MSATHRGIQVAPVFAPSAALLRSAIQVPKGQTVSSLAMRVLAHLSNPFDNAHVSKVNLLRHLRCEQIVEPMTLGFTFPLSPLSSG